MAENKDKLNDEDLEKVSGGLFPFISDTGYTDDPSLSFNPGDIVEDSAGIRYQILCFDEEDTWMGKTAKWYKARVIYVPESARSSTGVTEDDVHNVNSSFVHLA